MEREDDLDTVVAKLVDQAANFNIQRFHCVIEIKVNSHILNLFIFAFISFSSLFGVSIQVFKESNLFVKAVLYIFKLYFFHWQHLLLEAVSYRQSLTKNHMASIEIEAKVIWRVKLLKLYLITKSMLRIPSELLSPFHFLLFKWDSIDTPKCSISRFILFFWIALIASLIPTVCDDYIFRSENWR